MTTKLIRAYTIQRSPTITNFFVLMTSIYQITAKQIRAKIRIKKNANLLYALQQTGGEEDITFAILRLF